MALGWLIIFVNIKNGVFIGRNGDGIVVSGLVFALARKGGQSSFILTYPVIILIIVLRKQ